MIKTRRALVSLTSVSDLRDEFERIYRDVARKAHERFIERGSIDGYDLEDWLSAEKEMIERAASETWRNSGDSTVEIQVALPEVTEDQVAVHLTPTEMLVTAQLNPNGRRLLALVSLPERVETEVVDTELADGVLQVTLRSHPVHEERRTQDAVA